jgi:hypothetical protein
MEAEVAMTGEGAIEVRASMTHCASLMVMVGGGDNPAAPHLPVTHEIAPGEVQIKLSFGQPDGMNTSR